MKPQLRNIEFSSNHHGDVEYRLNDGTATKLETDNRAIVDAMYTLIGEDYPEAFRQLAEDYAKSRANVNWFKFLVVRRFILCNFSQLDRRLDIDEFGRLNFENVEPFCPLRVECKGCGVVCGPKYNTNLSPRQREVMKLYMEGRSEEEIGDMLYIAVDTVRTTKRDAFRKADVHSLAEFMTKYQGRL